MDGLVAWLAGCLLASFTHTVSGGGALPTISLTGRGIFIIKVTCNIIDFFKFHIWQYYFSIQILFPELKQASLKK